MPIILSDPSKLIVKSHERARVPLTFAQGGGRPPPVVVPPRCAKIYVNGKERVIGKKSQYLLDMLTIEEQ